MSAYGQAMTEYGLHVGRGALAGAKAGQTLGKSTGATLDKATKPLGAAAKPSPAKAASAAAPAKPGDKVASAAAPPDAAPSPQPPPRSPALDRAAITPGLDRQELLATAGKPSMKLTNTEGTDVVEKYWYKAPGRDPVVVTLRNGKVAAVSP